jgi:hypothetical protein
MFQHNIGFTDIVIRYIIMMVVLILAGVLQSFGLMFLGVGVFLTAILGWCPIYNMVGFSTLKS